MFLKQHHQASNVLYSITQLFHLPMLKRLHVSQSVLGAVNVEAKIKTQPEWAEMCHPLKRLCAMRASSVRGIVKGVAGAASRGTAKGALRPGAARGRMTGCRSLGRKTGRGRARFCRFRRWRRGRRGGVRSPARAVSKVGCSMTAAHQFRRFFCSQK